MIRALIVSAALLAACAPSTATTGSSNTSAQGGASMPANAEEATAEDTCGMARFRHLIGTDASAIDRSTLPPATRVITPDMMVTQDFSPQRLNIMVGTDGKVGSMRCF